MHAQYRDPDFLHWVEAASMQVVKYRLHAPFTVYGVAAVVATATLAIRVLAFDSHSAYPTLILFVLPTILSALIGGFGPGVVATAISAVGSNYFLLPPLYSFTIASGHDLFQWATLIVCGISVSLLGEAMHRLGSPSLVESAPVQKASRADIRGAKDQTGTRINMLCDEFAELYPKWLESIDKELDLEGRPGGQAAEERAAQLLSRLRSAIDCMRQEAPQNLTDLQDLARVAHILTYNEQHGALDSNFSNNIQAAAIANLVHAVLSMSQPVPMPTSRTFSVSESKPAPRDPQRPRMSGQHFS